jgi:septal ring factor EnvC (AmiA/AmiB activator)
MFSLKPKESASAPLAAAPAPGPAQNTNLLKGGIGLALVLILGLGYNGYSTRTTLEDRISTLEKQLSEQSDQIKEANKHATDMASDLQVVTKRVGVTGQELDASRKFAEKLKAEQEKADQQLASELATKASSTDVAAARQEATAKAVEVQQVAETKIGAVSGDLKKTDARLDATSKDLADSRREITDVRSTLTAQIARNAGELSDLRKKGERDYFEFDIAKPKKN